MADPIHDARHAPAVAVHADLGLSDRGGSPQPWRPSVGFAVFAVDYPLLPSERTAAISGLWIAAKIVRMFAMRLSDGPS
jgi:hypothetical protein